MTWAGAEASGRIDYLEIHVTPENTRLQLHWPAGGFARLRAKKAGLDEFTVDQTDWVQSTVEVGPGYWATRLDVPADRFGVGQLAVGQSFFASICRYHYPAAGRMLSTTALLSSVTFHDIRGWRRLVLSAAD